MTTSNTTAKPSYYNDSLTAVGYFNRAREINRQNGNKGKPYLAISFCKFTGSKEQENLVKTYINLIVRGERAIELINQHMDQFNDDKTPAFASVRITDLTVNTYTGKDGEVKASMNGRLLEINYLKIGGVVIDVKEQQPESVVASSATSVESSNADADYDEYLASLAPAEDAPY